MNKKIMGLILIIITVVTVSGCVTTPNKKFNDSEALEMAQTQFEKDIANPEEYTNITITKDNSLLNYSVHLVTFSGEGHEDYSVMVDSRQC